MKKTAIAAALLVASSASQGATLTAGETFNINVLADGVSCFTFGDCTTGVGAFTDNDTDALATNGSSIAGDGFAGVINVTTADDGNGGVTFSVNSFNMDTYLATAGGAFGTFATDVTTMSGAVDAAGNVTFDPTGRSGVAQFFAASLGEQPWNTGSTFTSGTQTNFDPATGLDNTTLTGTALALDGSAVIISSSNVGPAWGFFDGTPYTEVFSLNFLLKNIARPDSYNIDQGTTDNSLTILDNDVPASATIISIDTPTPSIQGTVVSFNSGDTSLTYTPPADLAVKSDTIDYTMSDGVTSRSATITITIIDTTAPVIVLNGTDPMNVQNGDTYVEPGANCTDNFDIDKNATVGGDVVDTSIDGSYVVTYDCSDSAGNTAIQVTRTLQVITGDPPPTISVNGADPLNVPVTPGDSNSFTQAIANSDVACSDNKPNPVLTNDAETAVDTSTLGGPFVVTYDCLDDAQQSATSVMRNINVVDEEPPVVTPTGPNPTNITVGSTYVEQGASCTDNFDQSPTIEISPAEDTVDTSVVGISTTITYSCTDNSGNSTLASIVVNTTSLAPVITLNGDENIPLFVGQPYTEEGAVCDDDVDANSEALISGDIVDTSVEGTYTIRYNCSDSDGLDAIEVIRTVEVTVDTEAPIITLNGAATIELNKGFSYFEQGAVCSDNADDDKDATIGGDTVDTATQGSYAVNYSCSDSANNLATVVTRTVNINTVSSSSTSTTKSDKDDEIGSVNWWLLAGVISLMTASRRKAWRN